MLTDNDWSFNIWLLRILWIIANGLMKVIGRNFIMRMKFNVNSSSCGNLWLGLVDLLEMIDWLGCALIFSFIATLCVTGSSGTQLMLTRISVLYVPHGLAQWNYGIRLASNTCFCSCVWGSIFQGKCVCRHSKNVSC